MSLVAESSALQWSGSSPYQSAPDPHGSQSARSSPPESQPEVKAESSVLTIPAAILDTPQRTPDGDAQLDRQRALSRAISRHRRQREAEHDPPEGQRRRRTPTRSSRARDAHGEKDVATSGEDDDDDHMGNDVVTRGINWRSMTTTSTPSSAQLRRNGMGNQKNMVSPSSGTMAGSVLPTPAPASVLALPQATVVLERPCRPLPLRPRLMRRPPHAGIKERFNDMDGSLASMALS